MIVCTTLTNSARAETFTITDEDSANEALSIGDYAGTGHNIAENALIINMTGSNVYLPDNNQTYQAGTVTITSWAMTNAHSDHTHTFEGVVSGTGNISLSRDDSRSQNITLKFNNSMDAFSGNMNDYLSDILILHFSGNARGNSLENAVAGTGSISTKGTITFALGSGASAIRNSSITTTNTVSFNGTAGAIYELYCNVTASTLDGVAGVTTKVTTGNTLTSTGVSTINGALELESGATLSVASGSTIGGLSMTTDSTLTLTGSGTALTVGDFSLTQGTSTDYTIGYNLSVDTLSIASGVTATLASGNSLTIEESSTIAGSLTLAGNNTLTVAQGTSMGTLDSQGNSVLNLSVTEGMTSLTLGSLTLTGGILTLVLNSESSFDSGDVYTLISGADLSSYESSLATYFDVELFNSAAEGSLSVDGSGNLIYTIMAGRADLTWNGTESDNIWKATGSSSWLDAPYKEGDDVTFGDTGAGTVNIEGVVTPNSLTVENTAGNDYTFDGGSTGEITGATSLIKNGVGKLTISNMDNSFTGGVELNGGHLVAASAGALGSGDLSMAADTTLELLVNNTLAEDAAINYSGGQIIFGEQVTSFDHTINAQNSVTALRAQLSNNANLTWGTAVSLDLTFTGSGNVTYNHDLAGKKINLAEGVTLNASTASSNIALAGAGTLNASIGSSIFNVNYIIGFTGTIKKVSGSSYISLNQGNDEASRFLLHTGDQANATSVHGTLFLGTNTYLRGIEGDGNISVASNANQRHINILLDDNYTWNGNILRGDSTTRLGVLTVASETPGYVFTWTGYVAPGNENSIVTGGTNAKLLIGANATVDFAKNPYTVGSTGELAAGAEWRDEIEIEATGKLRISRDDDTGFVQQATGNVISGAGSVEITGKANFTAANTYTGGTTVDGSTAILTLGHHQAAGVESGDASGLITLKNAATLVLAETIGDNAIANDIVIQGSATMRATADDTISFSGNISGSQAAAGASVLSASSALATLTLEGGNFNFSGERVENIKIDVSSAGTLTFSSSTVLANVTLTGLTTTKESSTINYVDSEGITHGNTSVYTIAAEDIASAFAATIEGTLTLDLGEFAGETDKLFNDDLYAFALSGLAVDQLLAANVDKLVLKINGISHVVSGSSATAGVIPVYITIPEPSTATLSLLALTALAARRRRKQVA